MMQYLAVILQPRADYYRPKGNRRLLVLSSAQSRTGWPYCRSLAHSDHRAWKLMFMSVTWDPTALELPRSRAE